MIDVGAAARDGVSSEHGQGLSLSAIRELQPALTRQPALPPV